MEELEFERELVTFSDDDGNEFEMEIVDYFDFEGDEYAVMVDADESAGEEDAADAYLFKIVENGEFDEFVPVDEDKLPALIAYYETLADEEECDEEECHACDCECEHRHE